MARSRILFEKLFVTQLVNNLTTVPVLITKLCQRTVSCARKSGTSSSAHLNFISSELETVELVKQPSPAFILSEFLRNGKLPR